MRRKLEKRKLSISSTKQNHAITSSNMAFANTATDANTFIKVSDHKEMETRQEATVRSHTVAKVHLRKNQVNPSCIKKLMNSGTKHSMK